MIADGWVNVMPEAFADQRERSAPPRRAAPFTRGGAA
jgi:hypothetical protein